MTTGDFTNWAGTIADIGPIYPFVGTEWLLVLITVVFWIGWHIIQFKGEVREYDKTCLHLSKEKLEKAVKREL